MLTASIFKIFGLSDLLAMSGTTLVFTYNSEFVLLCLQTIKKETNLNTNILLFHLNASKYTVSNIEQESGD
jgi:hypothetical protein